MIDEFVCVWFEASRSWSYVLPPGCPHPPRDAFASGEDALGAALAFTQSHGGQWALTEAGSTFRRYVRRRP